MICATLFVHPLELGGTAPLWLLAPLCAGVAIVYKTVRVHHPRRLVRETAWLMAYMAAGLAVLGAALWAVQDYWP